MMHADSVSRLQASLLQLKLWESLKFTLNKGVLRSE